MITTVVYLTSITSHGSKKFFFLVEIPLSLGPAFLLLALFIDRCSPIWDGMVTSNSSLTFFHLNSSGEREPLFCAAKAII